jgi:hypothetical protein
MVRERERGREKERREREPNEWLNKTEVFSVI